MLRPLPDLSDPEAMAKLGRLYVLREAWRDAVSMLRDASTLIQSADESRQTQALSDARSAIDRLDEIKASR
jgi:uncharacterized protein HemY